MASPLVAQGTLNRLRGSVTFNQFAQLNVTAPFLGPEGINLTFGGVTTDTLETMTGTVQSPAPYQMATCEIELLKTQSFSDLFKQQIESNAYVGDFTVRVDTTTLGNYLIQNGAITAQGPGRLNGRSVAYLITITGFYSVNGDLF